MSDEEFAQEAAWDEFCSIWRFDPRVKKGEEWAKSAFMSLIHDHTAWTRLRNAAKRCMRRVPSGAYSNESPWDFIKGRWRNYPKIVAQKEQEPEGVVVPARAPDPAEVGFDQAFATWPKNFEFPERVDAALSSWRSATRRHGTEKMVNAVKAYVTVFSNPKNGFKHPSHFSKFCRDDEAIEEFLTRATAGYSAEEDAAFDAVAAWYPDTVDESLKGFYVYHVKPEERFDFLMAVQGYREARRDAIKEGSDERFTIGFLRFVAEWRIHLKPGQLANALALPMQKKLRALGANDAVDDWNGRFRDALRQLLSTRTTTDGLAEMVRRVSPDQAPRAVEIATELVSEVYIAACVPPRTVLSSTACP